MLMFFIMLSLMLSLMLSSSKVRTYHDSSLKLCKL